MKRKPVNATLSPTVDHRERIFISGHHQPKQVQITGNRRQRHHLSVVAGVPADTNDSREGVEKFQKVGML